MNIGANKKRKQDVQRCSKEAQVLKHKVEQAIEPLNNRLHFL